MKLNRYLAVSLLCLLSGEVFACSYTATHAGEVLLYRIMPLDETDYSNYATTWESDIMLHKRVNYRQDNLLLWQKQTSMSVALADIDTIIYKSDIVSLQSIRSLFGKSPHTENTFVNWILANKRTDIVDFLILAKQNERILNAMNDPWYYHVDDNGHYQKLAENVEACRHYTSGPLLGRYALQMVRALCLLRQYDECVRYWRETNRRLPDNVVKKMTELKVASALYKTGHTDEALGIYAQYGDVASIRAINKGEIENELEFVYEHCPNSPYIEGEIQKWLLYYGSDYAEYCFRREEPNQWDAQKMNGLLKVAQRAVKEKTSKQMAMWFYTLASLHDMKGEPYKALHFLNRGRQFQKSSFLRDSYRVLHMWLEAQTAIYDSTYEQRLMNDLKWLVSKIEREVPASLSKTLQDENNEVYYVEDTRKGFQVSANSFYWNDAMRRILLRKVCPRMHEAGNYTREIQLANLADNLLGIKNDYANEMFVIMDRLSYKATRNYFSRVYHPEDEFDRFLNNKGKTDKSYWYDILATKCMREHRYQKALVYLKQIPLSFQQRMNVYCYMDKDPFSYDMETFKTDSLLAQDCKLHFAEKMALYERNMKWNRNPNIRAEAKMQYAMGLRNSVHRCWYLTRYSSNNENNYIRNAIPEIAYPEDSTIYRHDEYMRLSERLISEAINTYTDKEMAASELRKLLRYQRILESYGGTTVAKDIRQHCDRWKDYICQNR